MRACAAHACRVHAPRCSLRAAAGAAVVSRSCVAPAGLERFNSLRLLVASGVAIAAALYVRTARTGGLPSDLIDFDPSGTGLGGAPARAPVLVGAPANL